MKVFFGLRLENEQWGMDTIHGSRDAAETVSLPIAFPSMPISAMATLFLGNGTAAKNTGSWTNSTASVVSYTTTAITVVDDAINDDTHTRQVSFFSKPPIRWRTQTQWITRPSKFSKPPIRWRTLFGVKQRIGCFS